jgi:beta-1,4-mannooligosaccharide/beta-1,4-mannosyl-N-acetylglucosamine phosphorylase
VKYKVFSCIKNKLFWEDRQGKEDFPVWRYSQNPLTPRNPVKGIARIFNSGVAEFGDKFVGIFRGETLSGIPYLYLGWSDDGRNWDIDSKKISFSDIKGKPFEPFYSYDPRLVKIEDTYYIIWCAEFNGPSLSIARTKDFVSFERLPWGFLPFNRNGVLFPEKIGGKFVMLSRPSDNGHTKFGDIFISESPDLIHWGNHQLLMKRSINGEWWESVKIGAGPSPIKTSEGWLLLYHGVAGTCNGFVYSMGGALLDLDDPSKVIKRCDKFLLTPEVWYEEMGFVPNVIFPCAALCDEQGRIAIYYGAADTYLAAAFSTVDIIIDYIKNNGDAI